MAIAEQIDTDLITAIKAGDELRRDVLRLVKSSLKSYQIDNQKEGITDEEAGSVIAKEIKRRKESIDAFTSAGRAELAENEQKEIDILQQYMPEQMSEEQIRQIITTYFETNPKDASQKGKIMGALSAELKGKADMGLVAKLLQEELQ